ncbi:MAG: hypothetical protein HPY45_07975 [Anaerolineae bacterium]|nr:hypothetical protein [Anaerolineae bacterium]
MKNKIISCILLALLLFFNFSAASAQTYRFELTKSVVNFFVNSDGSASIEYYLTFKNDPGASPLDAVDIGLPNSSYEMGSITADIDGVPLNSIETSPYVSPGIAVNLGAASIPPGKTATVHVFIGRVTRILHPSEEEEAESYASFQFSPTWFGSEYVRGKTDMTVTLFLPAGMNETEPRYYPPKNWPGSGVPEGGFDEQGRVFYRWQSSEANGSTQYTFGAGFPARLVPPETIVAPPQTGPFDFIISALSLVFENLCCFGFGALFVIPWIWGIYQGTIGAQRRKLKYLPPKISVEGHGIKRGLTAVEAAILMEQPMDKIMTMILFSVIKKGAATVVSKEPLKLEIAKPLPEGLHNYEKEFLEAFETDQQTAQRSKLQEMMINLVKSVTEKMKGFSRKETVEYYKSITEKAWQYVQAADTPEVKTQKYDEVMDWTMLDKEYSGRTRETFGSGPVYVPMWWGRYDPVFRSSSFGSGQATATAGPSAGGRPSAGQTFSMPSLPGSDFAASVINSTQTFSAGVLGNLAAFTGGVTNKTNPIPVSKSSGYRGGGGGRSCACACACAGCACACAGGGR